MYISSFADDLLDLNNFAARLTQFIQIEHQFVEHSLVIALSSKYGSGKTTFLRMWRNQLETDSASDIRVVSLNAWESDYYGDPLFAIVSGLVEEMESKGDSAKRIRRAAAEAIKDISWYATGIGNQVATRATGIDPIGAGAFAAKKKTERNRRELHRRSAFTNFEDRKSAMRELKEAIAAYVESTEPQVIFLVDELDRCRPDYAISYLEVIKHIFDIKGAIFVLAADRDQLGNSAKAAFGPDLDFDEYYRKFVHREASLPRPSEANYRRLVSAYTEQYLNNQEIRHCFMKLDRSRIQNIVEFLTLLSLTPRQTEEVFRILGHILGTTEKKSGQLYWCLAVASIAMAAFKVGDRKIYQQLNEGRLKPTQAISFLSEIEEARTIEWWFMLFYTGGGIDSEGRKAEEVFADVGHLDTPAKKEYFPGDLSEFETGWGHSPETFGFSAIYGKIEQLSKWD